MKYNYKIQSYYDAALNDIEGKDICDICGSRVTWICLSCHRNKKINEVLDE